MKKIQVIYHREETSRSLPSSFFNCDSLLFILPMLHFVLGESKETLTKLTSNSLIFLK